MRMGNQKARRNPARRRRAAIKKSPKFPNFQSKISPAGHYTWWALKENFRALRRQNDREEGDQINENSFRKTKPTHEFSY
jgi:hypothetical protein